jgi:hypothetical protein
MEHQNHNIVLFTEKFDTKNPKVNAGILWCNDCGTEFAPKQKQPARTQ